MFSSSHVDLLWIIPVSLGLTWLGWKIIQIGYVLVAGLFEWLMSPRIQGKIDRAVTGTVMTVMLGAVTLIVLRVLAEATK